MKVKIMKKLLLIMLIAQLATAQRDFKTVFSIGIDPKMALQGPHIEREGNGPSLDYEVSFGFEWEHIRGLMQIKSHEEINFTKWTYLQIDYKQPLFKKWLKNLYGYAGVEFSQIRRRHPDFHYSQPDNYREVTINPMQLGINAELQYKLMQDRAGIAIQSSWYQAEDFLKPYKDYRFDVTVTLFFYL